MSFIELIGPLCFLVIVIILFMLITGRKRKNN